MFFLILNFFLIKKKLLEKNGNINDNINSNINDNIKNSNIWNKNKNDSVSILTIFNSNRFISHLDVVKLQLLHRNLMNVTGFVRYGCVIEVRPFNMHPPRRLATYNTQAGACYFRVVKSSNDSTGQAFLCVIDIDNRPINEDIVRIIKS